MIILCSIEKNPLGMVDLLITSEMIRHVPKGSVVDAVKKLQAVPEVNENLDRMEEALLVHLQNNPTG